MRKIYTLAALIFAALFTANAQSYEAHYTDEDIEVDGIADEAFWSRDFVVAEPITNDYDGAPTTGDSYFKAIWTDDGLYVFVEVDDDAYYPAWKDESTKTWLYDKIELYFEIPNLKREGASFNGNAAIPDLNGGFYQFAPDVNDGEYESELTFDGTGAHHLFDEAYFAAASEENTAWTMEFMIPFSSMKKDTTDTGISDADGMTVGFEVLIADRDAADGSRTKKTWAFEAGDNVPPKDLSNTGDLTFSTSKVGVQEMKASLAVYPNPAHHALYISNAEVGSMIHLINIGGQTVKTVEATSKVVKVDLNDVQAGLYIVKNGAQIAKINVK